jgi:hypothetical protein
MAGAENLFDRITPWFEKSFANWGTGVEGLSWALGLTTLPDPARMGQFVSAVTLYSQVPTQDGDVHLANTVLMSPGFTEATVDDNVRDLVANFRQGLHEARNPEPQAQPNLANLGKTNGQS